MIGRAPVRHGRRRRALEGHAREDLQRRHRRHQHRAHARRAPPVELSAGYVAIERIRYTIDGREGSFDLWHVGLMNRGERALTVRIVPDAGTGALATISGSMDIRIVDKKHHYEINYELGA